LFNIAVALVALLAGGIASIAGFGIGSLLTPLVASQYGMKTAVSAIAIPHFIATVLRFWRLHREVDRQVLLGFGGINAGGSLAGAVTHVWVNNPILSIVLGILLVLAALLVSSDARIVCDSSGARPGSRATPRRVWRTCGQPRGIRSAAMLGLGVQGPAFVATATAIGILVDAVRMPVYFITEHERMFSAWPVIVDGIVGVVLGTLIGERLLRKIPEKAFRRTVSAILVAIGVSLLGASPR
jgi:uncharacterized membrane protein YfcA